MSRRPAFTRRAHAEALGSPTKRVPQLSTSAMGILSLLRAKIPLVMRKVKRARDAIGVADTREGPRCLARESSTTPDYVRAERR